VAGTGKLTKPGNRKGKIGVGVSLGSSNRGQTGAEVSDYLGKYVWG